MPFMRRSPQRSGSEPFRRARARLGAFFLAVPRCGARLERREQLTGDPGDRLDGVVEDRLVHLRRLVEPADLADELQRRVANLLLRHRRLEIEEVSNVPAHTTLLVR